jgi:protein-tyrosine phosphatase
MTAHPDDIKGVSTVRVLVVCTANMCRSPLAASVIAAAFADAVPGSLPGDELLVESAGITVEPGAPWCEQSAGFAGVDPAANGHVASPLDVQQLRASDVIVTLDRSQRAFAARMLPQCRARLFTLTQASMLAERVGIQMIGGTLPEGAPPFPAQRSDRLRWFIGEMDAARGLLSGMSDEAFDIADMHDVAGDHGTLVLVRENAERFGRWLHRVAYQLV